MIEGSAAKWRCQNPWSSTTTGPAFEASSRTGSSILPSLAVAPKSPKTLAVTKLALSSFSWPSIVTLAPSEAITVDRLPEPLVQHNHWLRVRSLVSNRIEHPSEPGRCTQVAKNVGCHKAGIE